MSVIISSQPARLQSLSLQSLKGIALPVVKQPLADTINNGVVRIYADTTHGLKTVNCWVVFRCEDAVNHLGTPDPFVSSLYHAYNFRTFGRTADLESFTIEYDKFGAASGVSFGSYSGSQHWSHGCGEIKVGSAVLHSEVSPIVIFDDGLKQDPDEMPIERVDTENGRPVVFVNTPNHLMSTTDTNEGKFEFRSYESPSLFKVGGMHKAEEYAKGVRQIPDADLADAIRLLEKQPGLEEQIGRIG